MYTEKYERYDIYLAKLPDGVGQEQKGTRPVVIYNVCYYDYANDKKRLVFEAYCLTSQLKKIHFPLHFVIKAEDSCLLKDSMFLGEQTLSLYEENLIQKIGSLTSKEYRFMMHTVLSKKNDIHMPTTKYSYEFLTQAYNCSFRLKSFWGIEKEFTAVEISDSFKKCCDKLIEELIDICKKHNVITINYIADLSKGDIDFSLLNL